MKKGKIKNVERIEDNAPSRANALPDTQPRLNPDATCECHNTGQT